MWETRTASAAAWRRHLVEEMLKGVNRAALIRSLQLLDLGISFHKSSFSSHLHANMNVFEVCACVRVIERASPMTSCSR